MKGQGMKTYQIAKLLILFFRILIRIWISTSSFFNWAYTGNHKIINTEVKIVGKAKVK